MLTPKMTKDTNPSPKRTTARGLLLVFSSPPTHATTAAKIPTIQGRALRYFTDHPSTQATHQHPKTVSASCVAAGGARPKRCPKADPQSTRSWSWSPTALERGSVHRRSFGVRTSLATACVRGVCSTAVSLRRPQAARVGPPSARQPGGGEREPLRQRRDDI